MKRKPNLRWIRWIDWENGSQNDLAALIAGACLLLILTSAGLDTVITEDEEAMPDFALIGNVERRKSSFFEYMLPIVEEANFWVIEQREEIQRIRSQFQERGKLSRRDRARVDAFLDEYRFDPVDDVEEQTFDYLLSRVDKIPPSLALSQAALESAWGISGFAKEGNNLFGMGCYERDCGMVPKKRPSGKSYEVAMYDSPKESFLAYFKNLNTNKSYVEMRSIRRAHRENVIDFAGNDLLPGLRSYSQEGAQYLSKLQKVIRVNDLSRFD